MALEDALNRNNELIEKQNLLLEKLLAQDPAPAKAETKAAPAGKAEKAPEPASAEKPAEAAPADDDGPTYATVKANAAAWLGEHPKGSDEQSARRAYLESELWPKLGIQKLGDLEGKPADLAKVQKWLDTKAKTDLLGYGAGIFAAPSAEASSDEDEL